MQYVYSLIQIYVMFAYVGMQECMYENIKTAYAYFYVINKDHMHTMQYIYATK